MRRGCFRVVLAVVVALSSVVSAGPAAVFLEGLQASCAELRLQGARREAAAAAAAERFLAGGTLWVTGSIPRFDIEWLGRAGGLMAVRALREVSAVQPGDVVVYGSRDGAAAADAAWLRPLRERGAMVVVFAPQDAAAAMGTVADACLTAGMASTTPRRGEALAVMAMADLWAFTGDLAAACSRAGRWPVFWQSVMVPGARERNARFKGTTWHEGVAVPPQAPGALGERYLAGIAADLDGLRSQEDRLVAAGAVVRAAWSGGRTVFHANLGHFEPVRLLDAEPPRALRVLTGKDLAADLRGAGQAGDALLAVWYTEMPTALLQAARERGLRSVCILGRNPDDAARDPALADVLLDAQWSIGDALLEVPGYDVRILPPSGVLNAALFYAAMAAAAAP